MHVDQCTANSVLYKTIRFAVQLTLQYVSFKKKLFLDFSSSVQADKSTANCVLYLISTLADRIDFTECAFFTFLWGEVRGSAI